MVLPITDQSRYLRNVLFYLDVSGKFTDPADISDTFLKITSIVRTGGTLIHIPQNPIIMIIVHDVFICKPGNASKLAKKFKEGMTGNSEFVHIMTDMTGQFNKVVMVTKYENLTDYEASFEKYMQNSAEMKKMSEAMAGYHDMYLTGSREIYKVW